MFWRVTEPPPHRHCLFAGPDIAFFDVDFVPMGLVQASHGVYCRAAGDWEGMTRWKSKDRADRDGLRLRTGRTASLATIHFVKDLMIMIAPCLGYITFPL